MKTNNMNSAGITIEPTKQVEEDYIYEIMDDNDNVIETDFVCLETAIEYALENGGVCINKLWFPTDEYGNIDYNAGVSCAEIAWQSNCINS